MRDHKKPDITVKIKIDREMYGAWSFDGRRYPPSSDAPSGACRDRRG